MSELPTAPRRIEWTAPEGWAVWADEDGVHLRTVRGDCLEQPDVLRLIALYQACRSMVANREVPAPMPPTAEQLRELTGSDRAAYFARTAAKAVSDAINPPNLPF